MQLKSPFLITSRLMAGLEIGGATLQLERLPHRDDENRDVFKWTVDLPDGTEHNGADLRSGYGGCSMQEAFESLLSFLNAAGESFNYAERHGEDGMSGENSDCFPFAVTQWASGHTDLIDMTAMELQETEGLIVE